MTHSLINYEHRVIQTIQSEDCSSLVCSGVIDVKVFVDIEDQTSGTAIGICDSEEGRPRTVGNEGLRRSPVVTRKKNQLCGGPSTRS